MRPFTTRENGNCDLATLKSKLLLVETETGDASRRLSNDKTKKRTIVPFASHCTEKLLTSRTVSRHEFSVLDTAHPYGVQPEGNRLLNKITVRSVAQTLLTDSAWYHVLEFCSGCDLARITRTCRYLYVVGSQPELWRDLVLRECAANSRETTSGHSETIRTVGRSWNDTYVKRQRGTKTLVPHVPMSIPGIYSDYLYRLHSCRSFAIPTAWLDNNHDTMVEIAAADMTSELFLHRFEQPNCPVKIRGAASPWSAVQKWPSRDYCVQQTKGQTFRTTSGLSPLPGTFSLDAYFDYCQRFTHLEEAPLYLFDRTALAPGSALWQDYMTHLQQSCPYWDPKLNDNNIVDGGDNIGHDLFKLLGEGRRPDHTWLIIGPRRSGSVFHIDPNATHAWNAAICGRKRWILYPPGVTPPGVYPSSDGDQVALPLSVGEWIFQFWDEHVQRTRTAPPHERPLECTARPGDIVFVPHGWWHMVINLDETNIAITHNYVSVSNLSSVLRFLREKPDQVSGCRDRSDSIQPAQLYDEFVQELRRQHPSWLARALRDDWACRAWTTTLARPSQGRKRGRQQSPQQQSNRNQSVVAPNNKKKSSAFEANTSLWAKAKAENGAFTFSFM